MFDLIFHPKEFFRKASIENGKMNLICLFIPSFLFFLSPIGGGRFSNAVGPIESNAVIFVLYLLFFLYSAGFYKITMVRNLGWKYFTLFPGTFLPFILLPISLTLMDLNFLFLSFIVTLVSFIWTFILEMFMFKELMKDYPLKYHIFMKVLKDLPAVLFMYGGIFNEWR